MRRELKRRLRQWPSSVRKIGAWPLLPDLRRKELEEAPEPVSDWRFTDQAMTIAVETRPSFPHSVNTFCFTHGAKLYIPAANPSAKKWPEFVRQNPSVRLRIAGKIYSGRVRRVTDAGDIRELLGSLAAKYPAVAAASQGEGLPDYAIYRFDDQATAP